ncbi:Pulmonary surfactant-associated protein C [Varanus komodoensis]|uniref:pulmonary surfactant-associated protein C-like n=1 Tax=Varanus komodoensis TaxID=61221 RepID=UPI001CF772CA|nr:pulmonary surfactant-associated protein C-like [Varanus komodoensis]KAF7236732.1 Pulmonary surfactant-associated protein C [Varanus komodoensis]
MEKRSSKDGPMLEAQLDYTASPQLPGLPCKNLLVVVVVVVVVVVIALVYGLIGQRIIHKEAVLHMSIQGLAGEGSPQHLSMSRKEIQVVFHISTEANSSATVVYDYSHLLLGYRPWPGRSCYIARMDQESIPSLDQVAALFQRTLALPPPRKWSKEEADGLPAPLADRSLLGTATGILCSSLPVFWA